MDPHAFVDLRAANAMPASALPSGSSAARPLDAESATRLATELRRRLDVLRLPLTHGSAQSALRGADL